nr:MAG TPA: ParB protein [Caudoviricetes sp.]
MEKKKQIIYKKVVELVPYENNPRNNDEAVDYVANSIKQFHFQVPIIIDKDNVVVAGHTRLKACKKLGIEEVPCIVADDLTEDQIKAFRIADNKVGEVSTWDIEKPELEFTEVLGEEHNYVVLYFDNDVDWLQAESLFDIKPRKNLSTRTDGKITESMTRVSVGRVLNGAEALERLRKHYENIG